MTPATWGAAIEVPLMAKVVLRPALAKLTGQVGTQLPPAEDTPVWAEVMVWPGAAISGLSLIGEEARRGPRDEKPATVSAAVAALRVPLTGPEPSWATMRSREALEIEMPGMVMLGAVAPVPPMTLGTGSPTTLLAMMTPMAPLS